MKEREELEQPRKPHSSFYTPDTNRALMAEIRRGADPYKLARYFDVPIKLVLRLQSRQQMINELLRRKDGNNTGTKNGG